MFMKYLILQYFQFTCTSITNFWIDGDEYLFICWRYSLILVLQLIHTQSVLEFQIIAIDNNLKDNQYISLQTFEPSVDFVIKTGSKRKSSRSQHGGYITLFFNAQLCIHAFQYYSQLSILVQAVSTQYYLKKQLIQITTLQSQPCRCRRTLNVLPLSRLQLNNIHFPFQKCSLLQVSQFRRGMFSCVSTSHRDENQTCTATDDKNSI
ncbi:Hypothetical_protein [Hexamita inflata]|uniref:Hypothetical_protein n=1 Tax=Hexamita inflata TaxID=28002 RepID=A0AA86UP44_9EUKA|nr:Hypothetical protein HINF_LOCUS33738 [Hexamita inflata]